MLLVLGKCVLFSFPLFRAKLIDAWMGIVLFEDHLVYEKLLFFPITFLFVLDSRLKVIIFVIIIILSSSG